jgi:hypothetical protein
VIPIGVPNNDQTRARMASIGAVVAAARGGHRDARVRAAGQRERGVWVCPAGLGVSAATRERGGRGHRGFGSAPDANQSAETSSWLAAGPAAHGTPTGKYTLFFLSRKLESTLARVVESTGGPRCCSSRLTTYTARAIEPKFTSGPFDHWARL